MKILSETKKVDYIEFKKTIQKYSIETIDKCKYEQLTEPKLLEDRIGFPLRLDRKLNEKSIMIMGINPAGSEVDPDDYLCIVPGYDLSKKYGSKYSSKGYFEPNYELIKDIAKDLDIRLFWSSYDIAEVFNNDEEFIQKHNAEILKNGLYLVFTDIIYFHETSSEILYKILKDDRDLDNCIKKLLETQIEYYNPKYIIVTNAWVSNKIHKIYNIESPKTNVIINDIHFIFSGFVSAGRLDKYNKLRLKEEIKRIIIG